jgi:hypothetical protein
VASGRLVCHDQRVTGSRSALQRYWAAAIVFLAGVGLVVMVGVRTESLVAIMYTCGILGIIIGIAVAAANQRAASRSGRGGANKRR